MVSSSRQRVYFNFKTISYLSCNCNYILYLSYFTLANCLFTLKNQRRISKISELAAASDYETLTYTCKLKYSLQ
jgi:hypothetical protein